MDRSHVVSDQDINNIIPSKKLSGKDDNLHTGQTRKYLGRHLSIFKTTCHEFSIQWIEDIGRKANFEGHLLPRRPLDWGNWGGKKGRDAGLR